MQTIDANWLRSNGGDSGPWLLTQPTEIYRLITDATALGTGFIISASGVTLDLGVNTLTYGSAPPIVVPNGDFVGLTVGATSVDGWDLSKAPGAAVAENTNYLFGDRVLRIIGAATLLSDPIPIPLAGRSYAASLALSAPGGTQNAPVASVVLNIVKASDGSPVASGSVGGGYNGNGSVCEWIAATTDAVRIQIVVTPADQTVKTTIDIGHIRMSRSRDYGVVAAHEYQLAGFQNFPVPTAYMGAASPTIRGGKIIQGAGRSYAGHAIQALSVHGRLTVLNTSITLVGDNVSGIQASMNEVGSGSDSRFIQGNSITYLGDIDVPIRAANLTAIDCSSLYGNANVSGNTIASNPQIGIALTNHASAPQTDNAIYTNAIYPATVVTNGYAIALTGVSRVTIHGNEIDATRPGGSGQGITIDGYDDRPMSWITVSGNRVKVRHNGVREYGLTVPARAIRIRNNANGDGGPSAAITHLDVNGNTFEAHTGDGLQHEAFGGRVSLLNQAGKMNNASITIRNNVFRATVETNDPAYSGKALALDGIDAGINPNVAGNTFESNDLCLAICDSDGEDVHDCVLTNNTISRYASSVARVFKSIRIGYWLRQVHGVKLVGTKFIGGADPTITWEGTINSFTGSPPYKEVESDDAINVSVTVAGSPQPNALVVVTDKDDAVVLLGKTDSTGIVTSNPIPTRYTQSTQDPTAITATQNGPYSVVAIKSGFQPAATVQEKLGPMTMIPLTPYVSPAK